MKCSLCISRTADDFSAHNFCALCQEAYNVGVAEAMTLLYSIEIKNKGEVKTILRKARLWIKSELA